MGLILPFKISQRGVEGAPDDEYRFGGDISDKTVDAYHSHMHDSTLDNFVEDANNRVQLLDSHAQSLSRSLGYSVSGERSGDTASAVFAMLRDAEDTPSHLSNNEHIRRVEKGMYNDLSVGFFGGREVCDLCQRGMWEWTPGGENCSHWPGQSYDGRVCTYTIHDARLGEVSLVSVGANPNAGVTQRSESIDKNLMALKEKAGSTVEPFPPTGGGGGGDNLLEAAGKRYRDMLIGEALKQGVRADGTAFDRETWKTRFEGFDIDMIEDQTRVWKELADIKFGGGRVTSDSNARSDHERVILPDSLFQ